jgi:hypothetical protein
MANVDFFEVGRLYVNKHTGMVVCIDYVDMWAGERFASAYDIQDPDVELNVHVMSNWAKL